MTTADFDPHVVSTCDEISKGGDLNWMIMGPLPSLSDLGMAPGAKEAKELISVLMKGSGGSSELRQAIGGGSSALWGVLKDEGSGKVVLVHYVPESMVGTKRAKWLMIGKQVSSAIRHNVQLTIANGSDFTDAILSHKLNAPPSSTSPYPSRMSTASTQTNANSPDYATPPAQSGPAPLSRAVTAQSQASLAASNFSLALSRAESTDFGTGSEAEYGEEERKEEGRREREREKEVKELLMKRAQEERVEREEWTKSFTSKSRQTIEAHKAAFRDAEGKGQQYTLACWMNELTPDGRFWNRRWAVVEGPHLHIYTNEHSPTPLHTLALSSSTAPRPTQETYYFVTSFAVKDRVFMTERREEYYKCVAGIECGGEKA